MNKSKSIAIAAAALAAALGAAPALAESQADYVQQNRTPFAGTLSRADVQARLAQATQRGELLGAGEALGNENRVPTLSASRDRAGVRAEAVAAAHAPNQNLDRKAFFNSTVPAEYERGSLGARAAQAATPAAAGRL